MKRILVMALLALSGMAAVAQDGEATLYHEMGFVSGPMSTASYLSPDGTKLLHVQGHDFCLYTPEGEQRACANIEAQTEMRVRVDNESVVWSPDSRYVAFNEPAFVMLIDSDLWLLDTEDMTFRNLTDDGYEGGIGFRKPEGVSQESIHVDLTPAWHPDGRLTFVRYPYDFESPGLSVWAIDPAGGEPEPLFETVPSNPYRYYILSLDWSQDGLTAAYVVDSPRNPIAGVWVYETERERARPIFAAESGNPNSISATLSPDGTQVLLTTDLLYSYGFTQPHEEFGSGVYVIGLDDLKPHILQSEGVIVASGWLPDGRLIYSAYFLEYARSGLFVTDAPDTEGTRIFALSPDDERQQFRLAAPTSMQRQPLLVAENGLLAVAVGAADTYILQIETE